MTERVQIGEMYEIQDDITGIVEECTVVRVEPDYELSVFDIYLKAKDIEMNDKTDPMCEPYWKIITIPFRS